jgi:hypothetical protein
LPFVDLILGNLNEVPEKVFCGVVLGVAKNLVLEILRHPPKLGSSE